MSIRQNRFFNDPNLGAAFSALASAFEPPSGSDAAGWAAANAKNAEAKRLADFFKIMTDPASSQAVKDAYGIGAGAFLPSQGYELTTREQDLQSADRRYDADQSLAGVRYGADRAYAASTENNVRDNATAQRGHDLQNETSRLNNAADNARASEAARLGGLASFFDPLAEGAVRPAVPADIARLYGAPGALPEAQGRAAPLSSDERIGAVMGGMPIEDQRQFVRDKFAPSETQVQGEERRRLAEGGLLSDQALLDVITGADTPVEAIGADGRPTFMSPGAAVRQGAQPAPRSPSTVINTGATGDGKLRGTLDEAEGKRWSALHAAGVTAAGLRQDLDLLSELIKVAPQGPLEGRLATLLPGFSNAGAAFQSITSRAAPGLRVEGSGATSDIEFQGMVNSLPQLRNNPEANVLIAETMRRKADLDVRRAEIVTAYQNGALDASAARARLAELNAASVLSPGLRAMIRDVGGEEMADMPMIEPGMIEGGFRYLGGDPGDEASWEAVR